MQKEILEYTTIRKDNVKKAISLRLSTNTGLVARKAFLFYFNEQSQPFQQYYVQSIANRNYYLSSSRGTHYRV